MEGFDRVRNEVPFGDIVVLEDILMTILDELLCQLFLAFAGIGLAARSEEEDVSSA